MEDSRRIGEYRAEKMLERDEKKHRQYVKLGKGEIHRVQKETSMGGSLNFTLACRVFLSLQDTISLFSIDLSIH